jgi:tetrathionate reductase subunit B
MRQQGKKAERLTRRKFLIISGAVGMTVVGGLFPYRGRGFPEGQGKAAGYNWEDYDYIYLIDTTKCIGCGMCVQACKRENDVPDGFFRTWVERYRIGEGGRVEVDSPNGALNGFRHTPVDFAVTKGFFVPKICNICRNAPCIQVCPVGATYITKDGAVLVDGKHCIGCGYCVQACPYGMRFINPHKHTADKCTLCYHRITRGLKPACVHACPVGARALGNLKDRDDPVKKIITTERVDILQPELLTKPYVYYLGLDKEVR